MANWESIIETVEINANTWYCNVGLLVEFNQSHTPYANLFKEVSTTGPRVHIQTITMASLTDQIKFFANEFKSGRPVSSLGTRLALYPQACNAAWEYLSKPTGDKIPVRLLAYMIKFEILRLKQEHIRTMHKRLQMKKGIDEEFAALLGTSKPCLAKPADPKVKSKTTSALKIMGESQSKLVKRGEEHFEHDLVDDSPKGGPNFYVILSGFYEPQLIVEMIKIKIPLVALIQMRRDNDELDEYVEEIVEKGKKVPSKSKTPTDTSGDAERRNSIIKFWINYSAMIKDANVATYFEEIAFVTFRTPNSEMHPERAKDIIYDNISYLMYDIFDIQRQHVNYINHFRALNVVEEQPPVDLTQLKTYNGMLQLIPLECMTIPIILHCLLEEVGTQLGENEEILEPKPVSVSKKLRYSEGYKGKFLRMFKRIENKHRNDLIDKDMYHVQLTIHKPVVIDYGNNIAYKTFHLTKPKLNLCTITNEILQNHMIPRLWTRFPRQQLQQMIVYNTHLSKLFKDNSQTGLSTEDLWHNLHLKVFSKMACTSPIGRSVILPIYKKMHRLSNMAIAGDIFRTRSDSKGITIHMNSTTQKSGFSNKTDTNVYLGEIIQNEDLAKLFDANVIDGENSDALNIYEYETIEKLDSDIMLQTLCSITEEFNCIDYHYFPLTDMLLLHAHNSLLPDGIVHDKWECSLPTPVCLRDFVNYVLDEEIKWIQYEDKIYVEKCKQEDEEELKRKKDASPEHDLFKQLLNSHEAHPIGKVKSEDFIMPGSIKEQKRKAVSSEALKVPSMQVVQAKPEPPKVPGKAPAPDLDLEMELELFPPYPPNSIYERKIPKVCGDLNDASFVGYDLGKARVQISGTTTQIHSDDGTSIKLDRSEWFYGSKNLLLKINKGDLSLVMHSLGTIPPKAEDPFTFHVHHKYGMVLAFSKTPVTKVRALREKFNDLLLKRTMYKPPKRISPLSAYKQRNQESVSTTNKSVDIPSSVTLESSSRNETRRDSGGIQLRKTVLEPSSGEMETKRDNRMSMENQLNAYLMSDEVLDPEYLKKCAFVRTREQILTQLAVAKKNYLPCYRIHSSKLHIYRYMKRIKPHITVSIDGVIKKINYKPPAKSIASNQTTINSKWQRFSDSIKTDKIPLDFEFSASWPNGLSISVVPTNIDYDSYYVKQKFLSKGPACKPVKDEESRCFLRNGMVLIFRKEGELKILTSNGSIFVCQVDGFKPVTLKPKRQSLLAKLDRTTVRYKKEFKELMKEQRILNHLIVAQTGLRLPLSRRMYLKSQRRIYRIAKSLFMKNPNLIPIPEYTAISPDGSKCTVRDSRVCQFPSKLIVQHATDYMHGESYTEREDGTRSLLFPDGTLITNYPDGTRITTSFCVDCDEITVEFSEEELIDLDKVLNPELTTSEVALLDNESVEYELVTVSLKFESFVSVYLVVSFEHPNYAPVSYTGWNQSGRILMPKDLSVKIMRNGTYQIDHKNKNHIKIKDNEVQFTREICDSCNTVSISTINIEPFTMKNGSVPECYVVNKDASCQTIHIGYDGTVKTAFDRTPDYDLIATHSCIGTEERRYFKSKERFFVLDRDLCGLEYLSKQECDFYTEKLLSKKWATTRGQYCDKTDIRDNCVTLTYGLYKNYSEEWLTPYKMQHFMPTYLKRKDLLPFSCYPRNWLSPYPPSKGDIFALKDRPMEIPQLQDISRTPVCLIRRVIMDISKGFKLFEAKYQPLLDLDKCYDIPDPPPREIDNSSAVHFRERWYKRQLEEKRYKEMIANENYPKYFSSQMQTELFPDVSTDGSVSSIPLNPLDANSQYHISEECNMTQDVVLEQERLHKLLTIARRWVKNGYDKIRENKPRRYDVETQTEIALKEKSNNNLEKLSEPVKDTKKVIVVMPCRTQHMKFDDLMFKKDEEPDDPKPGLIRVKKNDVISPRCVKKIPKHVTGAQPYMRPLGRRKYHDFRETKSQSGLYSCRDSEYCKEFCKAGSSTSVYDPDKRRVYEAKLRMEFPPVDHRGVQTQRGVDESVEADIGLAQQYQLPD